MGPRVGGTTGATALTQIQKTFAWLAVLARRPPSVPALHHRQGICNDPVLAIRDRGSCLMGMLWLVFSTIPIKLNFIMCCQTQVLFKLQILRTSMLIIIQMARSEKKNYYNFPGVSAA